MAISHSAGPYNAFMIQRSAITNAPVTPGSFRDEVSSPPGPGQQVSHCDLARVGSAYIQLELGVMPSPYKG